MSLFGVATCSTKFGFCPMANFVFFTSLQERGQYPVAESHIRMCPLGVSVYTRSAPSVAIELAEPFIRQIMPMPPGERYGAAYAEAYRQMARFPVVGIAGRRWRPPGLLSWFG